MTQTDTFWDFHTDEGRKAFLEGVAKDDCPFIARARLAWINGWSIEFGLTPEAQENERKALKAAASARAD